MNRQTFFERHGPFTIAELADRTGASLSAGADLSRQICDVAPLTDCGPPEVTFAIDRKRMDEVERLEAGGCYITPEFADRLPDTTIALVTPTPETAFAMAVAAFYPDALRHGPRTGSTGNGPIDDTASLEQGAVIEAGAVIGANVEVGAGTLICANAVICAGVKIGRNCTIGPAVSIMHALIGDHVIIHPGARIGQDGFGYVQAADGFTKIPQIGRVIIQNNVEIGANATIDRGALADTVIGEGSKVDNLVQIGHNVTVGRYCVMAAQVGISGSATLGDGVLVAGQAGLNPHVDIGAGVQIGPQCGVNSNVSAGSRIMGTPSKPIEQFVREVHALRRLTRQGAKQKGEK